MINMNTQGKLLVTDLDYARVGALAAGQLPADTSVVAGFKLVLAAVVLLPLVFGLLVVFALLFTGGPDPLIEWLRPHG